MRFPWLHIVEGFVEGDFFSVIKNIAIRYFGHILTQRVSSLTVHLFYHLDSELDLVPRACPYGLPQIRPIVFLVAGKNMMCRKLRGAI